jgi:hypothetical protein
VRDWDDSSRHGYDAVRSGYGTSRLEGLDSEDGFCCCKRASAKRSLSRLMEEDGGVEAKSCRSSKTRPRVRRDNCAGVANSSRQSMM